MAIDSNYELAPPHSIETEESFLGSILIDPASIVSVSDIVTPSDFYRPKHKDIYDCMLDMHKKNIDIDVVTLCDQLENSGKIEIVGGLSFVTRLMTVVNNSYHIESYAKLIRKHSLSRQLISFSGKAAKLGYNDEDDAIEKTQSLLNDISLVSRSNGDFIKLSDATTNFIDDMENHDRKSEVVPTGFFDLDRLLGGLQRSDLAIIGARTSQGKAQPLSSKVLTPEGYKMMGEIKTGDYVIGKNGKSVKVVGVFPQGVQDVYKVSISDGTNTRCTGEHLWFTQTHAERKRKLNNNGSVKTTEEIMNNLFRYDGRRTHKLPIVDPVVFYPKSNVVLNPYVMGALLGDGGFTGSNIKLSNSESDIIMRVSELLSINDAMVISSENNDNDHIIKRKQKNNEISDTRHAIESYGLYNHNAYSKFIPEDYLLSNVEDRIELLRGLFDSDGSVINGHSVEFSTSSEHLINDVKWLVRSLGGIASNGKTRIPTYTYKGKKLDGAKSYRTIVFFPNGIIPVSSKKHLSKWNYSKTRYYRSIVNIEKDGQEECQCIKIDNNDGLYVTDDFIITHNTALGISIADNAGITYNKTIAIFSIEMSTPQIVMRFLARESGIDSSHIRDMKFTSEDIDALRIAYENISNSNIYIDDSPNITIMEMRSKIRSLAQTVHLDLVIVDYLQMITGTKGRNRVEELGEISRALKGIAKEINVPIIALAQLSRAVENRNPPIPQLSDLRESGNIEQDADIVMFIYREDLHDENSERKNIADILVAKHRNGSTGKVSLFFRESTASFHELSRV